MDYKNKLLDIYQRLNSLNVDKQKEIIDGIKEDVKSMLIEIEKIEKKKTEKASEKKSKNVVNGIKIKRTKKYPVEHTRYTDQSVRGKYHKYWKISFIVITYLLLLIIIALLSGVLIRMGV